MVVNQKKEGKNKALVHSDSTLTASTLLISGHARQASININKEGRERGGRKEEADSYGPCPDGVYNLEINQ